MTKIKKKLTFFLFFLFYFCHKIFIFLNYQKAPHALNVILNILNAKYKKAIFLKKKTVSK